MATKTPVAITPAWTLIYNGAVGGAYTGSVQANGPGPVVGLVVTGAVAPAASAGGFAIGSLLGAVSVGAAESLWARSIAPVSSVVLI